MDLIYSGIAALIALVTGFILGWGYVKAQITAIEARYRAELEQWKAEAAQEIRKDSVNRSRSTLKGKIAEQMAPVYPAFRYLPADARFIGSPVDYIVLTGCLKWRTDTGRPLPSCSWMSSTGRPPSPGRRG